MKHIIVHTADRSSDLEITEVERLALLELDWIEYIGDINLNGDRAHIFTDKALGYGGEGEQIVSLLHEDFPDVLVAAQSTLNSLTTKSESGTVVDMDNDTEETDIQYLQRESLVFSTIYSIFPNATFDEVDGELVVSTGLSTDTEDATWQDGSYRGRFNPPQPAIGPTPEGYTRVMVLDDGETFSGLAGCTVKDVVDEDLADVNDIDDLDPEAWSFVARFDADGIVV